MKHFVLKQGKLFYKDGDTLIEVQNQAETDHNIIVFNDIKGDSFESKGGITYNIKPCLKEGEIYSLECEIEIESKYHKSLDNNPCKDCKPKDLICFVSPIKLEKEQNHNFMLKDFTNEVIEGFEVNSPLKSFPSEWSQEEIDSFLKQQKVLTGFIEWYRSKQAVNTFNECDNNYILFEFFKHFSLYKTPDHVQTIDSTPISPTKVEDKEEDKIEIVKKLFQFIVGMDSQSITEEFSKYTIKRKL